MSECLANRVEEVCEESSIERKALADVNTTKLVQYSVESGFNFRPTTDTIRTLPPGRYNCCSDSIGYYFANKETKTMDLIRFPNSPADVIISEFDNFWSKKDEYLKRNEPHKRGFLLHGPPGGGKSSLVQFIVEHFIVDGNIVIDFNYDTVPSINILRRIEPDRKLLVIIEDIDTFLVHLDIEQQLLSFLDGGIQHVNTVVIATTNFPEKLPTRIKNRPSRFDRMTHIGVPTKEERLLYLRKKCQTTPEDDILRWAKVTNGWTLAHLKELILSVEVHGLSEEETINRLNEMRKQVDNSEVYEKELAGKGRVGFDNS